MLHSRFAGDGIVRIAGASDALSALIGERTGYDAVWASGLGISASHAVPDAGILTMTELLDAAATMDRATSLPVVADCDTGFGDVNVVRHMVARYERAGIAAVCIEDKEFPKRNSFLPSQQLADPAEFGAKIRAAKDAQTGEAFMVIARLESFIAGAGLEDALRRAQCFVDCGADAILVHSKAPGPDEVFEFAERWGGKSGAAPLVCVPTTYTSVTEKELDAAGYSAVIYANQALRAAVRAIYETLGSIRAQGTIAPVEDRIAPLEDLFELVGVEDIERFDAWFAEYVELLRGRGRAPARPREDEPSAAQDERPRSFAPDELERASVRAAWQRDGFVHVRGVLDRSAVEALADSVGDLAERMRSRFPGQPLSDQGSASVRVKNILEQSSDFDSLIVHPQVVEILEWLMGRWFKLLGSEAFTRAEETDFLLPFHTDGGPLLQRVIPAPDGNAIQVKVQFFLTDADRPGVGQLLVVPGSHLRAPAVAEPNCYVEEANSYVASGAMPPGAIAVPARAGDITIHTHSLWHAVGPNPTGAIRRSVILRYGQPWCAPHDYDRYDHDVLNRFPPTHWRYLGNVEAGADPADVYKPREEELAAASEALVVRT